MSQRKRSIAPLVTGLLLALFGSVAFASRLWVWVLHFDPGFVFAAERPAAGPPLTARVTLLLVDGLRLDVSRRMETLNGLRTQGADIEAQVGTPSFSRPGRATVAVGAPPDIHGVTTNRQKREIPLDNLFRRVSEIGGTCRVAGSKIWPGLFSRDIDRCGAYRVGESKEGPGAFVRQVPDVRTAQEAGLAFVLEKEATLRIADLVSTDFAAHEYGGASPEYLAEVQRADALLAGLVGRLDLSKETLIVTADHGHRDQGGHGGSEAPVLAIPIVMAGAGIKPGMRATAHQADIAPTIAVLLGTALPAASSGRPMINVLALDPKMEAPLEASVALHRTGFERSVADRLGIAQSTPGTTGWLSIVASHRNAENQRRRLRFAVLTIIVILVPLGAMYLARPRFATILAGAVVSVALLAGPVGSRIPVMSFSAINYDDMLIPFLMRVMTLAALTTLVALLAVLIAGHYVGRREFDSALAQVGSVGLLGSAALGFETIRRWWSDVLLSPFTLPGPDRLVEVYSLTLSIFSVALTTLLTLAGLRLIEAMRRPRS